MANLSKTVLQTESETDPYLGILGDEPVLETTSGIVIRGDLRD
jgi:hypothetical protein